MRPAIESRSAHMAACKKTALDYLKQTSDLTGTLAMFLADTEKHPGTKIDPLFSFTGMMAANSYTDLERWIEGFAE